MKELVKGIFKENPVFILLLGLCPALAVSNEVQNAVGMGGGVLFVLIGSNVFVSLLKDFIPEKVRIPAYIVIIASFVTIVKLVMKAYLPDLDKSLGVFVDLIVVNCVILGRAEAFANKKSVGESVLDAIGMGIGFTLGLVAIAIVRELLGTGEIKFFGLFNVVIPGLADNPVLVFALPAGAMLVMGYLKAFFNWIESKVSNKVGAK